VLSGGGSAQVDPPGGNVADPKRGNGEWRKPVYFPSSPMREIQRKAPNAEVTYNDGSNPTDAAASAKSAELAIVFVNQFMSEGSDAATLSLPDDQDALVSAVAAANPNTIVVLETGGPVSMPWRNQVKGILEAWYPGIGGAQAMANVLFGDVDPSGKLPVTFAARDADLPHPQVLGLERAKAALGTADGASDVKTSFDVQYSEGTRFGYKWFDSEKKEPLYEFGFGLSYTTFAYAGLKVDAGGHAVSFTVTNTGLCTGDEIAEVYVELPPEAGENFKRLAGWQRVPLAPGESKSVTVTLDPLTMSVFDVATDSFELPKGSYRVLVGPSSREAPLVGMMVQ
jgi:beta-glucosidase